MRWDLHRNQRPQLCHRARQRQVRYRRPNLRYGLSLHHVQQRWVYFRDRVTAWESQSIVDCRAGAVRYLAHQEHRALRQVQNRSVSLNEFSVPLHQRACQRGDPVRGNRVQHQGESQVAHELPSSRVLQSAPLALKVWLVLGRQHNHR